MPSNTMTKKKATVLNEVAIHNARLPFSRLSWCAYKPAMEMARNRQAITMVRAILSPSWAARAAVKVDSSTASAFTAAANSNISSLCLSANSVHRMVIRMAVATRASEPQVMVWCTKRSSAATPSHCPR